MQRTGVRVRHDLREQGRAKVRGKSQRQVIDGTARQVQEAAETANN